MLLLNMLQELFRVSIGNNIKINKLSASMYCAPLCGINFRNTLQYSSVQQDTTAGGHHERFLLFLLSQCLGND